MQSINIRQIISIARKAGERIMEIYHSEFAVEHKDDQSPLTAADKASHQVIFNELTRLYPEIPILSEEGSHTPYEQRKKWKRFWLVDPIDGTKEFVRRNGEFTVNIALIDKGYPVFGVIYAPALDVLFYGQEEKGAFKVDREGVEHPLKVKERAGRFSASHSSSPDQVYTIVESRSHPSKDLQAYMEKLGRRYSGIARVGKGSSLKFCLVAEGKADCYPRFGPTMEWDTAAGQAIVEAAGGAVIHLDGGRLAYNKPSLRNDYFLALANVEDR